jgi:hypothetical protein
MGHFAWFLSVVDVPRVAEHRIKYESIEAADQAAPAGMPKARPFCPYHADLQGAGPAHILDRYRFFDDGQPDE